MIQKQNGKLYMDTIRGLVLVNMVEKKNQLKNLWKNY